MQIKPFKGLDLRIKSEDEEGGRTSLFILVLRNGNFYLKQKHYKRDRSDFRQIFPVHKKSRNNQQFSNDKMKFCVEKFGNKKIQTRSNEACNAVCERGRFARQRILKDPSLSTRFQSMCAHTLASSPGRGQYRLKIKIDLKIVNFYYIKLFIAIF